MRLTNLYGPWQAPDRIIPRITAQALLGIESEAVTGRLRDFLAVQDAVGVLLDLAENGPWGETFNLAAGRHTPLEEAAEAVVSTAGCGSFVTKDVPQTDGRGPSLVATSAHLTEVTGWKPTTDLWDGVSLTTNWYRENRAWWAPFEAQVRADRTGPGFLLDHAFPFWAN